MAVVVFDPAAFKLAFPEFTSVSDMRCTMLFNMAAQSLLDNISGAPVMDLDYRTQLFYLLIGHMLLIFGLGDAPTVNNTPPGRISSATEGTVSTQFEYNMPQGSGMQAWYLQTKYGAFYWMATAQFRSARYMIAGNSGVGFSKAFNAIPFNIPGGV